VSGKRPQRHVRDDDAEARARREELFDLAYPLAQRAAKVRASSATRFDYFDRDDLLQDAVTAVFAALDRYDERRASLGTFVERVASNRIASTLRHARAAKRTCIDCWPATEPQGLPPIFELRLDIRRVIGMLERRDRRVARLLEEYRPAEIARILVLNCINTLLY
jgi:RNA polymerase sigma factor (sigma-70 family)